jgi:nitrite reductase (NADH) large subunit
MQSFDYIIIGNSAAGIGACEGIRKLDKKGSIAIITEEKWPAYTRCLLTDFIDGAVDEKHLLYRPESFYDHNHVTLIKSKRAVSMDHRAKTVRLEDGSIFSYGKLMLATGSYAYKHPIPGIDLPGVYLLRNMDDAEALLAVCLKAKKAVVMGGGLVGLTVARALRVRGIQVCVAVASPHILSRNIDGEAAAIVQRHLEEHGIRIVTGSDVTDILGDGRVERVKFSHGEVFDCDMVVSAKGVRPHIELVKSGQVKTHWGIVVDDHMLTSAPNIYAGGDVAEAKDFINGGLMTLSIWPVAYEQGRIAGQNMAGGNVTYAGGIGMNSDEFFGLPIVSIGETRDPEDMRGIEYVTAQDPQKRWYKKLVLRDKIVIGVIMIGNVEGAGVYKNMICTRIVVTPLRELLLKQDFDYAKLVDTLLVKDTSFQGKAD